jgi:hypothetical protein
MVDQRNSNTLGPGLDDVGVPVMTTMPSAGGVEHAVWSFGIFSIFHQADAARTVDAEPGVITVVGNLDAVLDRGLQDGFPLLNRQLLPVDREVYGLHKLPII